jgi:hypothetical protein
MPARGWCKPAEADGFPDIPTPMSGAEGIAVEL